MRLVQTRQTQAVPLLHHTPVCRQLRNSEAIRLLQGQSKENNNRGREKERRQPEKSTEACQSAS